MYILAIETTGAFASVALADENHIIAHIEGSDRYSHLQNLTPQISKVLDDAGLNVSDVSAIAVSHGPGSFTGIRIGVSTARALSQVTGIPCVPVSSLEALAMRAADADPKPAAGTLICPILDARRKQVYGGGYVFEGKELREEVKAGPYTIDEFMESVSGYEEIYMLGDGIDTCGEQIKELRPEGVSFAPESMRYQRAEEVAVLGAGKLATDGGVFFEDLRPEYMRLAEAERKLRAKQAQQKEENADG